VSTRHGLETPLSLAYGHRQTLLVLTWTNEWRNWRTMRQMAANFRCQNRDV